MEDRTQPQIAFIIKDQRFEGFYLVKAAQQRTSASGSRFLDMTLGDISGEVNAKMWDGTVEPPKAGDVVKVRALMQEYNGRAQMRIDKMRLAEEKDAVDMQMLIPCAPQKGEDMLEEVRNVVSAFADAHLAAIVSARLDECGEALLLVPAALRLHHAERSGLLHHMTTMLRAAGALCEVYPSLDRDLLFAGIILHDLCKIEELKTDEIGLATEYTLEGQLVGHIAMGIARLHEAGRRLETPKELLILLEHMILSHHDLPEYGSPKPPMFLEAEVLHTLDRLDARLYEMNRALSSISPGGFTERIWSLERRLYKRESKQESQGE
ncbi:MAG: 3'-5' exoribonuclease YhaM family protein [Christensenellales bacterium]|jgi:3'-5' exoribonuclease